MSARKISRTRTEWVKEICACLRRSVEGILDAGKALITAKADLEHGQFLAMIKSDLPFGADTAQSYMAIARDARLSKAEHIRHLPPCWSTLLEITRLSDDEFTRLIADGTINGNPQKHSETHGSG